MPVCYQSNLVTSRSKSAPSGGQKGREKSALISQKATDAGPDFGIALGLRPEAPDRRAIGSNGRDDLDPLAKAVEPSLQQGEVAHRGLQGGQVQLSRGNDIHMFQFEFALEKLRGRAIQDRIRAGEE